MHIKQMENLLKLSAEERYDYFIRYCADFENVWGLIVGEDNWVIFKDQQGEEVFPVWPHNELAMLCMFDEHNEMGAKPQRIKLNVFIEKCIPDMIDSSVKFGVFFDKNREGLVVDGEVLRKALISEVNSVWE